MTLKLVVEGTEPISYFWYHDGELVEGRHGECPDAWPTCSLRTQGAYSVIAKNRGGAEISETVQLMVLLVPAITQLTESLTLIEGRERGVKRLRRRAASPWPYQWSKGGEKIDGAIHPKLHLARVAPSDAGRLYGDGEQRRRPSGVGCRVRYRDSAGENRDAAGGSQRNPW